MASDESDAHWLWRFDADAWLRAAATELAAGRARVDARRVAVTHARRAAGMAVNAVLVALGPGDELRWGRSYLEHLRALADADPAPLPAAAAQAAAELLAIPVVAGAGLVVLARGPHAAADAALAAAARMLELCAAEVAARRA
jgi:hypothetical protein